MKVVEDERGGIRRQAGELAQEGLEHRLERGCSRRRVSEQGTGRRRELGNVDPHGCDEMRDEAGPVAVATVEPEPQHPEPGSAREVGQQRCLAVAGLGGQEDDAPVDLDRQPIEQPIAREGLVAERRRLDLADLNRVVRHRAEWPSGGREAGLRAGGSNALDDQPRSAPSRTCVGPGVRAAARLRGSASSCARRTDGRREVGRRRPACQRAGGARGRAPEDRMGMDRMVVGPAHRPINRRWMSCGQMALTGRRWG